MRIASGISIALFLSFAGCGGGQRQPEDDSWAQESTSGQTYTTETSASWADAGIDSATGSSSGDPVRDRAMALVTASCTPCHRHVAPVDADATVRGVYLEHPDEILHLAQGYSVGSTPMSLASIIAQRAEGYELMVGPDQRSPMPPRGTSYPAWSQQDAEAVVAWLRAPH